MSIKQKKQDKASTGTARQGGAQAAAVSSPSKVNKLIRYFEDSRTELDKVSWPTRKEVRLTAFAVLALVVVMACFLGVSDLLFAKLSKVILSIRI